MVRTRNKNEMLIKNIKDYAAPIVGLVVVIIILFSVFGGGDNEKIDTSKENQIGLETTLIGDESKAFIFYSGGDKKKIEGNIDLYKGEKIIVNKGTASINLPGIGKYLLNKLGELKYSDEGGIYLYSSDLWFQTVTELVGNSKVNLKYISANVEKDSVVSFSQNEVLSTVYLLKGMVEVSNMGGKTTVLSPGQKISIASGEATDKDLDLSLKKEDIDDSFKASDWFIKNNGDFFLSLKSNDTLSGSTTVKIDNSGDLISLDYITDESKVPTSNIDVTGKYIDESVSSIVLGTTDAIIDTENKTFSIKKYVLKNKTNDLVFKVYDSDKNIIGKYIYTIYYEGGRENSSGDSSGFNVENFDIDASNFKIVKPSNTGRYTTNESRIDIHGETKPNAASYIIVNGHRLNSYNGTTWRYHAWTDYDNLKDGTNLYEINYYSEDEKLIFSDRYIIIKKGSDSTFSNEASAE